MTRRGSQNRAVVSNAQTHGARAGPGPCGLTPDHFDQLKLTGNHAGWRRMPQEKLPANSIPAPFLPGQKCNFYGLTALQAIERIQTS
jgi:hypothetical protein